MNYNKNLEAPRVRRKPAAKADDAVPLPGTRTTPYLNFRLDILSSDAMKTADKVYRRECGLDVRHLRVLRLVGDHPGITFSQLASETRLERGLASRIVTALTADGLVRRAVSAADARQFYLFLTAEGQAVRDQAAVLADKMEALLLAPLNAEERAALFTYLEKLTAWVRQGSGLEVLSAPRKDR